MRFANIIVDISHDKVDKTFQYIIPEHLEREIEVGSQVEIPFGKGGRQISGFVIEIVDKPCINLSQLKEISCVKKGSLKVESQLIALAWFIKEQYGSTMNKALKTVLPVKQSVKYFVRKYLQLNIDKTEAHDLYMKYERRKNTQPRAELIYQLMQEEVIEYSLAKEKTNVSDSVIRSLEKSGVLKVVEHVAYRNPVEKYVENEVRPVLNEEQERVIADIIRDIDTVGNGDDAGHLGGGNTHLIFGVTGSGKTEVYMEIIEHVIQKGQQVIVLIPEISLTYQTIKRFYNRFGDSVSIINSKLSAGERFDQFSRAKAGEVKIMVGPRTALFTPFDNLGLIVMDEEHEGAYKSDQIPKYHAREVAIWRAKISDATVILGSATPSISTYYKALKGEYTLHRLTKRANNAELPQVRIVDMREELNLGNRDIFSQELKRLIEDRLTKKEQVILFINRRGYSSFVSCRKCGNTIKCPHCDVSLTLHKQSSGDRLSCHYCGYSRPMPKLCPQCGSKYIGRFGIGTEQIEERLNEMFPEARVLRMDMDTTKGKNGHEKILSTFAAHEADILVGTQMIVKGHDFKSVTLVGIMAADLSLYAPDYMAAERTFNLITQAAGRAGRGELKGDVVIQTYNSEEPCILSAAKQDYEEFYHNEIHYRRIMTYPPVYDMMAILVSDKSEQFADKVIRDIAGRIERSNIDMLKMIGPSKASISKINDIYRNVIYLKHMDGAVLVRVKNAIVKYMDMVDEYKNVSIQFDFNPMTGY